MKSWRYVWLVLFSLPLQAVEINGAGASFPAPLYAKWFSDYNKLHPDVRVNYQSVGSGGGIRQFTEQTIDFGATDAPMNEEQLKATESKGGEVLHLPTVMGAVVVTYNLPGVESGLKLNAEVLADIFLGKLTKWDDKKIKELNPKLILPTGKDILVVHRSDGSGTSAIFTDFLSKSSPEWQKKVGTSTTPNWPLGLGAKGNEGVAGQVKQTPGSIGYIELIYAESNKLPYAAMKNPAGQFVLPSMKSVAAAAMGVTVPEHFRVSLTNAAGKEAYPISGFTYLLVWKNVADNEKSKEWVKLLKWALTDGQAMATKMFYAPLPEVLGKRVLASISSIQLKK